MRVLRARGAAALLAVALALAGAAAAADAPTAVHLAPVGDAGTPGGSMMVTWTTKSKSASTVRCVTRGGAALLACARQLRPVALVAWQCDDRAHPVPRPHPRPVCGAPRYGKSASSLSTTGTGSSVKFEAGTVKGTNTQYIHSALMGPLDANMVYYYAVGPAGAGSSSATYNFTYKVLEKFAVYGDFGLVNDQSLTALLAEASAGSFDAIIHAGDFAYDLHDDFGTVGDKFMAQIEPMVSHVPMAVAPGNHEEVSVLVRADVPRA